MPDTANDVQWLEFSYIISRNWKLCNYFEKSYENLLETKCISHLWHISATAKYLPKWIENMCQKRLL